MATTYLTLTNSVLRELNETELTSGTFSSSRGIQTAVKDFINKGIPNMIFQLILEKQIWIHFQWDQKN